MLQDLIKQADSEAPSTATEMVDTPGKLQKFSESVIRESCLDMYPLTPPRYLTSPVVTIRVGSEKPVAFNLHKVLVCRESAHLSKAFQGAFKETADQECILPEEDPRLFGYFVEHLYREGWLHGQETNFHYSKFSTLARLYTMGDRLMAKGLQDLTLQRFAAAICRTTELPEQEICDLLEIVGTELPDTPNEDPLQAQVFWYAASRMSKLQSFDRFPELLREHPQIAVKLSMRAGNATGSQPKVPSTSKDPKFRPESIY